jgi:hypothetical protein
MSTRDRGPTRIKPLVEEYADFPLGGTDASIVALGERLDARSS